MSRVSTVKLVCLALISIALYGAMYGARVFTPSYQEKVEAAHLMQRAEEAIRGEVLRRGFTIDAESDPNDTGLIGPEFSPIVTDRGSLAEKQTTINPNFAAVVVDLFDKARVKKGDTVAVGATGSFPALNIAVIAAGETLGLRLIIINSVGASNWGATNPEFTWLDMEKLLYDRGIFHHRSIAASAGGSMDVAANIASEGQTLIEQAIARSSAVFINESTLEASISKRMTLYEEWSDGIPITAYVNIGGGVASMGPYANRAFLLPGFNKPEDLAEKPANGVIFSMARAGAPVIHLLNIRELARNYSLPIAPVPMPRAGEGRVYVDNRLEGLSAALALVILGGSVALVRFRLAKQAERTNNYSQATH